MVADRRLPAKALPEIFSYHFSMFCDGYSDDLVALSISLFFFLPNSFDLYNNYFVWIGPRESLNYKKCACINKTDCTGFRTSSYLSYLTKNIAPQSGGFVMEEEMLSSQGNSVKKVGISVGGIYTIYYQIH
uniref:Gelsolin-like domain-containing protein n=1 Tax=Heterorhabditis bacteriophora TaxID=37862 RepID=A0A1I7WJA9_HETBA